MSRREWRSLILLGSLALVGHLVRLALVGPGQAPGALKLFNPATDGNPRAQQQLVQELMRPLGPDERIDADRASAAELQRLPGIGHALAARIVADRESHGPFGDLAGLSRVSGIGSAIRTRLASHLQFSGVPADISTASPAVALVDLNQATVLELDALPGIGLAKAKAIVAFRDSVGPFRQTSDLLRVPGLSKALVERLAALVVLQ